MKTIKLNLIFMFLAGMTLSQPAFSITLSSGHFGEVVVNWGNQIVPYSNVGESSLIGSSSKITLVSPTLSSGHFGEVVVNWGNQIVPYSNVGESSLS